ncbi:unnamed protein product [Polarella glacialis]|uniref:Uncharacterized protein n=2 Tax=Polarella glacialis TaxID=89957 RepID=A0A813GQV0_POLGL|nr:unnamed protein product [Polarella glacialis]
MLVETMNCRRRRQGLLTAAVASIGLEAIFGIAFSSRATTRALRLSRPSPGLCPLSAARAAGQEGDVGRSLPFERGGSGRLGRWPTDKTPEEQLAIKLVQVDEEWTALQAEADILSLGSLAPASAREQETEHRSRAASLLSGSAVDRLRPFLVPTEYLDIPPLRGAEDALRTLLPADDSGLVTNFLSKVEPLSGAARAFWQAELYLRQLDAEAGDSAVEEAAGEAKERIEAETTDWQQALQGSILLARQNFISATRFGYFLRRSRQRYDLERSFAASGKESNLADWLGKARPADAVEMVRPASKEASSAIEHRATELFGAEEMLLRQLHGRPSDMAQLEMSKEGRKQLSLEAAAFGAGLFAAEAAAAGCYRLDYTAAGSRNEGPLI